MGGNRNKRIIAPEKTTWLDKVSIAALIVCSAIVPLIIRMHKVELDETTRIACSGASALMDLFSYDKSLLLVGCMVLMLVAWVARIFAHKAIRPEPMFIPLGVYAIGIVGSTLVSGLYYWIALNGYPDRFEGAYVLICYVLLAFTASQIIKTEVLARIILFAIMAMSVIIALLGLSQFFGVDFLKTQLGINLIVPPSYAAYKDSLQFSFGKGVMYTTVYNPNYLGSLSALLLPIAVGLYYHWVERKKAGTIIVGLVFSVLLFAVWLGGMSRAGLLGGMLAVGLLFIFLFKRIIRHWQYTLLLLGVMICFYVGMDSFSQGGITREFINTLPSSIASKLTSVMNSPKTFTAEAGTAITRAISSLTTTIAEAGTAATSAVDSPDSPKYTIAEAGTTTTNAMDSPKTAIAEAGTALTSAAVTGEPAKTISGNVLVKRVEMSANTFTFITEMETVQLVLDQTDLTISVLDGEGNSLPLIYLPDQEIKGQTTTLMTIEGNLYSNYNMYLIDGGIVFNWKGMAVPLLVKDNRFYYMNKQNNVTDTVQNPPSFGFKGSELFGSSRGYIWSRSLPMLKDTLFLGFGPDTYAVHFPQDDIAGKMNWLGGPNAIVDKPHNWYLQVAINTGVLSLLALLVFIGWYGIASFKRWRKESGTSIRILGISILCGIIGYCVASFFNDSVVSVAPIFWVVLGLGIALLKIPATEAVAAARVGDKIAEVKTIKPHVKGTKEKKAVL